MTIEIIAFALAEMAGDRGLVGVVVGENESDEFFTAEFGLIHVFVCAWSVEVFTIELGGIVGADGAFNFFFFVGMHGDSHADVLRRETIADVACIGGGANRWSSHRVLDGGVIQCVGWSPSEGEVTGAPAGADVKGGGVAFANFGFIDGG